VVEARLHAALPSRARGGAQSSGRYIIDRHRKVERWMAGVGYQSFHEGGTRERRVILYRRTSA
jgi:hypothetical protein